MSYLDVRIGGSGLISGGRLARQLADEMGSTAIEDLPIRFAAIATEVGTGHEMWLTRGFAGAGDARLLRIARNFSAGAARRTLADGRRAGQSGAGHRGARFRRPRGHCGQSRCRPLRPRRDHRESWLGPERRAACTAARHAAPRLHGIARHVRRRARAAARNVRRCCPAGIFHRDGGSFQHHAGSS